MPTRRRFVSSGIGMALASGVLPFERSVAAAPTPDFVGVDSWLNTDGRPTISELRGKVVLVQFCTYTCINWRRTLPYVKRWNAEYGQAGLRTIGIHTPEFTFERLRPNVESALNGLGVTYPIAQDNEYQTWQAFGNRAWPAFYLMDGDGRIRLIREGEGHAGEIEDAIRSLLGLPRAERKDYATGDADLSGVRTPEMYFGSLHPTPQDQAQWPRQGEATYVVGRPSGPRLNDYELEGTWIREEEPLVLRSPEGIMRVRFSAAKLHLIAGSPQPAPLRVSVDGRNARSIEVTMPTLYTLLDEDRYGEHVLELRSATPGLSLFSATFG